MGRLIRTLAEEKNHEISVVIDDTEAGLSAAELADKLRGVDVAIDFTMAEAVRRNVEACVLAGVPLVEGTTGWNDQRAEIERIVREGLGAMVFGGVEHERLQLNAALPEVRQTLGDLLIAQELGGTARNYRRALDLDQRHGRPACGACATGQHAAHAGFACLRLTAGTSFSTEPTTLTPAVGCTTEGP